HLQQRGRANLESVRRPAGDAVRAEVCLLMRRLTEQAPPAGCAWFSPIGRGSAMRLRIVTASVLVALLGVTLLPSKSWWSSEAEIHAKDDWDHPASEGRRITPAGSFVLDAITRLPAVGALPVDFVRSPDRTGPDGKGRYLIAVNSGFGVQFSAGTNRAQQSLGVIDLNAKPAPAVIQNVYFPTPQSANVGVVFSPRPNTDGSFDL